MIFIQNIGEKGYHYLHRMVRYGRWNFSDLLSFEGTIIVYRTPAACNQNLNGTRLNLPKNEELLTFPYIHNERQFPKVTPFGLSTNFISACKAFHSLTHESWLLCTKPFTSHKISYGQREPHWKSDHVTSIRKSLKKQPKNSTWSSFWGDSQWLYHVQTCVGFQNLRVIY